AGDQLRTIVERIERLEEEKAEIATDIREVYAEAKGNGFDPKTIRQIIRLRKMEHAEREEHEALLDIYKAALGMLDGTPLGEAAIRRLTPEKKVKRPDGEAFKGENQEPEDAEGKTEEPAFPGPTIEEAQEMARKAAGEGRSVTDNPFPARDPRRAA